jgi:hypothetical protein
MKTLSKILTVLSGEETEAEKSEFLVASFLVFITLLILSINL